MGALQKKVEEAQERVEAFYEDLGSLNDHPVPTEVSMHSLRGEMLLSSLEDLENRIKERCEEQEDPVKRSLCLQLLGVIQGERSGLLKVLDALRTAGKAGKLNYETAVFEELKRIREKLCRKTNKN